MENKFRMVVEYKFILMESTMMVIGSMDYNMDSEKKRIRSINIFIRANGSTDKKMVKVRNFGKMDPGTMVTGKTEINMGKESFTDVMIEFILDNGKIINYTDMENSHGQMARNIRANTLEI